MRSTARRRGCLFKSFPVGLIDILETKKARIRAFFMNDYDLYKLIL